MHSEFIDKVVQKKEPIKLRLKNEYTTKLPERFFAKENTGIKL